MIVASVLWRFVNLLRDSMHGASVGCLGLFCSSPTHSFTRDCCVYSAWNFYLAFYNLFLKPFFFVVELVNYTEKENGREANFCEETLGSVINWVRVESKTDACFNHVFGIDYVTLTYYYRLLLSWESIKTRECTVYASHDATRVRYEGRLRRDFVIYVYRVVRRRL